MQYTFHRMSFDEWLAYAQREGDNPPEFTRLSHNEAYGMRSWYGHATWTEANALALTGWKEGRERMTRAVADIEATGEDRETMTYDVAGNEPDIGRYLEGDPENMLAFLPTDEKKIVRIVADVALSSRIDTDTVFTRGAALCCLIDRLEKQGHRCEVIVCSTFKTPRCEYPETTYVPYVTIKAPNAPLDIDRIAFCLAHAASERRLMFACAENHEHRNSGDYAPGTLPPEECGDITLPAANTDLTQWHSPSAAQAWINEQVCRFTLDTEAAQ